MPYAKFVDDELSHYPSAISDFVKLGVLTTETPTDEELAEANIIYISHCVDLRPNDGLQYDLKPMLQDDGTWIEKWYQVEASAERLEFLRQHQTNVVILDRNAKLAASDWTQMSDVNLTNKTEWAVYRQALRDLPEQEGFPFVVVYPQKPE